MKPKAALVKDGFLPPGSENVRGRLSGAAISRCEELAAKGWKIDGFMASSQTKTVVRVPKPDPERVFDIPDETRNESYWRAFAGDGEIGMRTVCLRCNSSLTYCPCPSPVVWLDFQTQGTVTFKPRKEKA